MRPRLEAALHSDTVFLVDVDNTLLDKDAVIADLHAHLDQAFGPNAVQYWAHFEALRDALGYADYLGALQRFRADVEAAFGSEQHLLAASEFLIDYPFARQLYPYALDVLAALRRLGLTALLSDGDVVFQPRKVQRSGLWDAVDGRVMIFVHKEKSLDRVQRELPARHYVMVDDKQRVLDAMKRVMGARLTTVFVRQGHYAQDPDNVGRYPAPDVTVDRIGDLLEPGFAASLALNPAERIRPT